uniref:WD40-domain-containing protein n=1 Tax=Mycena chlorophos TaxID=658473 RepID=A0ABQ0L3B3_MYCCL|nr:WD40-domain-containing protein [Mycena chlorophos]
MIAFISMAYNLSPSAASPNMNIYVRNLAAKVTSLASAIGKVRARGVNVDPAMSGDGAHVAFASDATNLTPQSNRGHKQIYVVDLASGTVTLASVEHDGSSGEGDSATPSLSYDGRFVAFMSSAENLASGCGGATEHVYVRDLQRGITVCVSDADAGGVADGPSSQPSISADGRFVAFTSFASNIVGPLWNKFANIYVKDMETGKTTLVSVSDDKDAGVRPSGDSTQPSISGDGQKVAFTAYSIDPSKGIQNAISQIYVRDIKARRTFIASSSDRGVLSNAVDAQPRISADGKFVVFLSAGTNLMRGEDNGHRKIYRYDLNSAHIMLVSRAIGGDQVNGDCFQPAISANGSTIAFRSNASNLIIGDTNFTDDVFVTVAK